MLIFWCFNIFTLSCKYLFNLSNSLVKEDLVWQVSTSLIFIDAGIETQSYFLVLSLVFFPVK